MEEFQNEAGQYWDINKLKHKVIQDQERRRFINSALRIGRYQGWDFKPKRNPENEFTRSHMDLSKSDYTSRYPRPEPFYPRWK